MAIYLGVDIGTSGVRTVAFTGQGEVVAEGRAKINVHYSSTGHAEQHPQEWVDATIFSLQQVAERLGSETEKIKGIGLTGQCPTFTFLYDNGKVLDKGILYSDNRAAEETEQLVALFGSEEIQRRTGQHPSSFYLLPKLMWLKKHHPEYFISRATVVQPRDYIGWFLTGTVATDPTHAACTLAYDLQEKSWIKEWLTQLDLGQLQWPEVYSSTSLLGSMHEKAAQLIGIPPDIPVAVGGADSVCAVFGSGNADENVLYDISGSTTCLHLITPKLVTKPFVNTYPHVVDGEWCLEVGMNTTGLAVTWLSQLLGMSFESLIAAARNVSPGADGLFFYPYLDGGERNNSNMPGAFIGLKLEHGAGHLARAVLEGITFALKQQIELMTSPGEPITNVCVSGGGAKNDLWNELKADIFQVPIDTAPLVDTTALGAARTVALALGEDFFIGTKRDSNRFYPDSVRSEIYEKVYALYGEVEKQYT
ncbi:xylulokinase [Lederbergia graminis]|uniref:FGGY-family carbohydrate kinase n=1 Tax=Lederbergia graminis TaxID=735518 RepID=A0ABW0LN38_9BACI